MVAADRSDPACSSAESTTVMDGARPEASATRRMASTSTTRPPFMSATAGPVARWPATVRRQSAASRASAASRSARISSSPAASPARRQTKGSSRRSNSTSGLRTRSAHSGARRVGGVAAMGSKPAPASDEPTMPAMAAMPSGWLTWLGIATSSPSASSNEGGKIRRAPAPGRAPCRASVRRCAAPRRRCGGRCPAR